LVTPGPVMFDRPALNSDPETCVPEQPKTPSTLPVPASTLAVVATAPEPFLPNKSERKEPEAEMPGDTRAGAPALPYMVVPLARDISLKSSGPASNGLPSRVVGIFFPPRLFAIAQPERKEPEAELSGDTRSGATALPAVVVPPAGDISLESSGPASNGRPSPGMSIRLPSKRFALGRAGSQVHTAVRAGATPDPAPEVKVLPRSPECTKIPSDKGEEYQASFPPLSGDDTTVPRIRVCGNASPNLHPRPPKDSGGEDPEPANPLTPPK